MCHVLTVTQGSAPKLDAPELPAEKYCPSCGAIFVSEEERRWGGCAYCLNVPLALELTTKGRRHAERH